MRAAVTAVKKLRPGRLVIAVPIASPDACEAFRGEVDAIVCPTCPTPAFKLGEKTSDPLSMYLADVYTLPASLAGLPAISVPCAPTRAGLPVGLQIIARPLEETTALSIAAAWESHGRG